MNLPDGMKLRTTRIDRSSNGFRVGAATVASPACARSVWLARLRDALLALSGSMLSPIVKQHNLDYGLCPVDGLVQRGQRAG